MKDLHQRALTDSDAAACARLSCAIADADDGERRKDERTFRFLLRDPMASPEFEDFQGVFDGDRLVATARVTRRAQAEPAHWMRSAAGVHPDYLGRGIGTRLARWQQDCARRIHEHHFPGRPLELGASVTEQNTAARELLANEGYVPERWFHFMRRPAEAPLPEFRLPPGFELEPYTDGVREDLHRADEEAFREHWQHVPMRPGDWAAWIGREQARHDLTFLLRDAANGEIAGFVISACDEAEAKATGVRDVHFNLIGTREAYRGRGIASALIAYALRRAREAGFAGATLGVDAENPKALGVYERAGFAGVRRTMSYAKKLG